MLAATPHFPVAWSLPIIDLLYVSVDIRVLNPVYQ